MKPASFEMSADTRLIRQRLCLTKIGEVVTDAELSDLIAKPVDSSSGCLRGALQSVLKNEGFVFARVHMIGVERLSDERIVADSGQAIDSIRRKARRGAKKLTCVADYSALTPQKQIAHTARLAVFTAVAFQTTDASLKKVEDVSAGRSSQLPLLETLRAFESDLA